MDTKGFQKYLKKMGKSQRITEATIAHLEEFERYLKEQKGGKELEEADTGDLDALARARFKV